MGIRFRKSFPLSKLLRFNLSKSGVSVGIGPPGLNVNIGPRGIRRTIGIPGTGVSYQESSSWASASRSHGAAATNPASQESAGVNWLSVIILVVLVAAALQYCSASQPRSTIADKALPPASAKAPPASNPPADRPLSKDEVKELQSLLARGGFRPGPVDGMLGPATTAAVKRFESKHGVVGAAEPTLRTIEKARESIAHGATR